MVGIGIPTGKPAGYEAAGSPATEARLGVGGIKRRYIPKKPWTSAQATPSSRVTATSPGVRPSRADRGDLHKCTRGGRSTSHFLRARWDLLRPIGLCGRGRRPRCRSIARFVPCGGPTAGTRQRGVDAVLHRSSSCAPGFRFIALRRTLYPVTLEDLEQERAGRSHVCPSEGQRQTVRVMESSPTCVRHDFFTQITMEQAKTPSFSMPCAGGLRGGIVGIESVTAEGLRPSKG